MGSIDDISQLCRLCLVKDQVNIPIFDGTSDIGQTFIKIESCLPVKVSRSDSLPKKICDGCSYKLDMLYTFRNTSIDSEKQLIQWLNQAGLSTISQTTTVKDPLASTTKPEIMVKQENFDTTDSRVDGDNPDLVDPQSYMIQQDQLGYEQEFVDFGEAPGSNANDDSLTDEPVPKRAKRAAALKKAPLDDETEDDLDAAMQITKAEEEDEEEVDQPEYVEAPSTSADDQPGPSGVGKATTEAPMKYGLVLQDGVYVYQCKMCFETFKQSQKVKVHTSSECPLLQFSKLNRRKHLPLIEPKQEIYTCDVCSKEFPAQSRLRQHQRFHNKPTFHCLECSRSYQTKEGLKHHIAINHVNGKDYEHCDRCDFKATSKKQLRGHVIKTHTKQYPYRCDVCNQGFTGKVYLQTHRHFKHEVGKTQGFVCEYCGLKYQWLWKLKDHKKRFHPEEPRVYAVCEICGKHVADLRSHRKTHLERLICHLCGKSFSTKYGLKLHFATRHTKERPFKCEICGKSFQLALLLKYHVYYIHTDKGKIITRKKFTLECHYCGKKFTKKRPYASHMRIHHKIQDPYKCQHCDEAFRFHHLLEIHKQNCQRDLPK